jgi:hypothetical protein
MCDFSADGYWLCNAAALAHPDLPIGNALRERLFSWQCWHDRYGVDDFAHAPRSLGIEAFSAEGLLIARDVKSELPHWTVIYHDAEKFDYVLRTYWSGHICRSYYEYPIWNVA